MSSARAVRCRLKCHNERNPRRRLPAGYAGDSVGTAPARGEEGGDDVKSARPLRPGRHTCYNGGYSGQLRREPWRIPKAPPSSDRSLQPGSVKLDSLVIAHQPWRGEYVPGPCTHRPSSHGSRFPGARVRRLRALLLPRPYPAGPMRACRPGTQSHSSVGQSATLIMWRSAVQLCLGLLPRKRPIANCQLSIVNY